MEIWDEVKVEDVGSPTRGKEVFLDEMERSV